MEVYFVRHGQTDFNKAHRYQTPDVPLNELGRKQAAAAAVRLEKERPTRIIASPHARTLETAKIIGEHLHIPVITNELLVELKRPESIRGHSHLGIKSMWYIASWFFQFDSPKWRSLGGESYDEFIDRLHAARRYLEHFGPEERVVVVSHSITINFFAEHVCNDRQMNIFEAFIRLAKIKALNNSSITHVEYLHSHSADLCTWIIKEFDDDGHVIEEEKT